VTQYDLALSIAGLRPGETPFLHLLAQTQSPLPSQTRTFNRLRWALQNRKRCPLKGSHDNRSRTRPYNPSNPLRMSVLRRPDRSVWLGPVQTRLTPAPECPLGVRMYSDQNQDVPRSGARPSAPPPAHNSVRAASAISWPPTPPAPNDRPRKLAYAFSSNAVSLDGDPVC
jgi:hypothetical protein